VPTNPVYQKSDSLTLGDTVYGIENEGSIPIRHTEIITIEELPVEKMFHPSPLVTGVESWQIIILLIAVFFLGIVKAFSNKRYRLGIKALINHGVAQEITREEQVFFHRSNIFLTITHVLLVSLFVYELKDIVSVGVEKTEGFNFFLLIVGVVIITYTVKYLFSKVLAFIFNDTISASEYIFNVSLYNNLLGVLLIPILCISYFSSFSFLFILLYAVIPIAILMLLLRFVRLFIVGRTLGVLYVYIFLYICTLEILPLVVLYQVFSR